MKYLDRLKKEENVHPDPLQKPQKDLFAVNAVHPSGCIPEKRKADPAPEPVDYDQEISAVMDELGKAQVIVSEVPTEIRRETLALEEEITDACNAGDVVRFRAALHAWRVAWSRCLH